MAAKLFARVVAVIYLLVGACAFVPVQAINEGPTANSSADVHVGLHFTNLFHQMPMNWLLAGILIGFGVSGLWTSLDTRAARLWSRCLFVTALVFMAIGFCPQPLARVFGLLPLYSWTTGFFLITALFSFYFAFFDGPVSPALSKPVFRQE